MNQTTWLFVAGIFAIGVIIAGLGILFDKDLKNLSLKAKAVSLAVGGFFYDILITFTTFIGLGSKWDNDDYLHAVVKDVFVAQSVGCICAILAFSVVCSIVYCLKKRHPLDEDSCC